MISEFGLIKSLADLGCTVVVCAFIAIIFYKLAMKFGPAFIAAQEKIADSMAQQAQSMSGVNAAIQNYIQKDNSEHREILLGLQVVGEHLKWLTEEFRAARKAKEENNGR
jgi:3-isopropylmalate dehydratase small subunit